MQWLRPGYMVRLGGDLNELSRHTKATRPGAHIFVDSLKDAWDFKQKHPEVEVAHRWEKLEEQIPKEITPQQWLADRLADFDALGIPHNAIVIYDTNEPEITPQLVAWWVEYATALLAAPGKPRGLMCNFGTGKPREDEIPQLRPLLALMVANPERLYLGLDEYAPVVWTAGVNGSAAPGYNERFKPKQPALEYPIRREEWFTKIFNNACWFMGRWRFWAEYCHKEFKKLPRIWIPESGFDDITDVEWWQQGLPTIAKGVRLAGWQTLRYAWQMFWAHWTDEEALWEQTNRYIEVVYETPFVAADGTVYDSPIWYVTLFGWSPMKWEIYDYSYARTFKNRYERHVAQMAILQNRPPTQGVSKPVDARAPIKVQVTFTGTGRTLRNGPGNEYKNLGTIEYGDVITIYEPTRFLNNGERWRWVEGTRAGDGWLCIDGMVIDAPPKPEPPAPEPVEQPAEPPVSTFKTYTYEMRIEVVADDEEAADVLAKHMMMACKTHYQQLQYDAAVIAALPHLKTADIQVGFSHVPGGNAS